jgi:translation initiation factor IF-3
VAQEVVVINQEGVNLGAMPIKQAIGIAQDLSLDLVEVGPKDTPPICKIMDFGRFKFQSQRKSKQKSARQQSKEVKFRPVTDVGDYNVKVKRIIKFLEAGARVQITIRFRGREIVHNHLAKELMDRVLQDIEEFCIVEMPAKLEGRQMIMIIKSK